MYKNYYLLKSMPVMFYYFKHANKLKSKILPTECYLSVVRLHGLFKRWTSILSSLWTI